jgi:RHS repeat-associated protein
MVGNCVATADIGTWASYPQFYDGYGEPVRPCSNILGQPDRRALKQPLQYKGQFGYYTDVHTDLCYCLNRYYDPRTGHWLSRDPIGLEGGVNVYQYCGGNPIMFADPTGLDGLPVPAAQNRAQLFYVVLGRQAPKRGLALLGPAGLCVATAMAGWEVGTALDRGFGISEGVGSREYARLTMGLSDPNHEHLRRMWNNSTVGHQLELEQQFSFLAQYGNARRANGLVEVHHLLPVQFQSIFESLGLNIHDHQFVVPLSREIHKVEHGKGGGILFERNWNNQWRDFFRLHPNPSRSSILRQVKKMRGGFGI